MIRNNTRKLIFASLFTALIYVGTAMISITLPFGYFNFGDFFILMSSWLLGGTYAISAAAIGSALADLSLGYVAYAPATFVIKALVAVVAWFICNKLTNTKLGAVKYMLAAIIAEIVMVLGYYLFECALYSSFVVPVASLPGNLLQGTVAIISAVTVITILDSIGLKDRLNKLKDK